MSSLRQWLAQGEFTLALSSSFFGFFAHCGITQALVEAGFRPAKVSGSSAGALVAAAMASGVAPGDLAQILFALKREQFWDPRPGLGYLRGEKMLAILQRHLAPTFGEAELPVSVAAFDIFSLRTRFLDSGSLPRAVAASCSVPLLFHPVRIGRRLYLDGGVIHKSGVAPLAQSERNLCVFIEGGGLSGAFERKKMLPPAAPGQRIWHFTGLPALSYNSLEKGPAAFEEAYRRARAALEPP